MRFIFSFILILTACDFSDPDVNRLQDRNENIVLREIAGFNVSVVDSNVALDQNLGWIVEDVTESSGWTAEADEFEIILKTRDDARPLRYHLTFETKNSISFLGFDSLSMTYNIDIFNLNDYYDNDVILGVGVQRLEYKVDGEDDYTQFTSVREIEGIELPMSFRIYMILNSGVNNGPYNESTYTINFGIYGHYE